MDATVCFCFLLPIPGRGGSGFFLSLAGVVGAEGIFSSSSFGSRICALTMDIFAPPSPTPDLELRLTLPLGAWLCCEVWGVGRVSPPLTMILMLDLYLRDGVLVTRCL